MSGPSLSLDDYLAEAKPRSHTVRLCLRGDLMTRHAVLEDEMGEVVAEMQKAGESLAGRPTRASELAAEIAELEAEIKAHERPFTVQASGKAWSDLKAKHPPTAEDREAGRAYNLESFIVPAIAQALVEPVGATEETVAKLVEVLADGQLELLWMVTRGVNEGIQSVPFSKPASAIRRLSEQSGTTAGPEASPDPGSLVGGD